MITTYDYIDANKKKTVLLTLLFPISLLVLMFVVLYIALLLYPELRVNNNSIVTQIINNYGVFFLVCIIFSTLWTIIAFFEGSNMVLKMVNAIKIQEDTLSYNDDIKRTLESLSIKEDIPTSKVPLAEIRKILENISTKAKIPTPNLYIMKDEEEIKTFVFGTKADCAVILTKNFIETADRSRLEAFMTREIERIVQQDAKKQVNRILENVSITAGIPTPNLYIMEHEKGLNAFAIGTNKNNCAVILTKGLVETLDNSELEAVIAHEVAHIVHQDTKLMMIVTLLIGFFTYVGYIMVRSLSGGRSSRKSNGKGAGIILIIGLAFLIYGYIVAPLIRLAVSRTREFHADAKSALLTRNPQALISALRKIENYPIVSVLNSRYNNNELVAPMCIENPLRKKVSLFDSLSNLSSTHPPIEKRIQALEVMDGRGLFSY